MSNHNGNVRVEFFGDGHVMSIHSAVSRFDSILKSREHDLRETGVSEFEFNIQVRVISDDKEEN